MVHLQCQVHYSMSVLVQQIFLVFLCHLSLNILSYIINTELSTNDRQPALGTITVDKQTVC